MKTLTMFLFLISFVGLWSLQFDITYSGFTVEQEAAFEAGCAIWSTIVDDSYPLRIHAQFVPLSNFTIITIPNLARNFGGANYPDVWYPTSLARKLGGYEDIEEEADVDFFLNSNENWYYGLDGNCPANSMDFVSQIFKAVPYALGYMSSFYVSQGYGSYGMLNPGILGLTTSFTWEDMEGMPTVYDTFISTPMAQFLTDPTFVANPSLELASLLTGGDIWYFGSRGVECNMLQTPALYAAEFNLARTARLSMEEYQNTENASGVPTSSYGQTTRLPSPIVMGILQDLGWDLTLYPLCPPPTNLVGSEQADGVHLSWDAPETDFTIRGYRICVDGGAFQATTGESYILPSYVNYTSIRVRTIYSFSDSYFYSSPEYTDNDENTVMPIKDLTMSIAPNPFYNNLEINYKNDATSEVKLQIFNVKGQVVYSEYQGYVPGGEHTILLNDFGSQETMPNGVYFIKLSTDSKIAVKKGLLIK
ncbi:MAG: T9SS type A sorting domain-containing protein [Candidatus Cloacimonetes bacterium]|nr:T9SS type A sorting domain-containing protein [Candidatus Cloacimonadota bacterium]